MPTSAQSEKNFSLTGAASDLGLGDQVKQQLEDQNDERKNKLLNQAGPSFGDMGALGATLSPASMALLSKAAGA